MLLGAFLTPNALL